jgi:glycerol-3-phosphate acyltransferase PlsY
MAPEAPLLAGAVAVAYLESSIPVAYLLGRLRGLDLRDLGTGNPGAANLFRNAGFWPAAAAGPLAFLQGLAPLGLARLAGWDNGSVALLAAAAVLGNGFPFLLGFHGGRVVAVGTGATAGLCPPAFVGLLACFGLGYLSSSLPVATLAGFMVAAAVTWLVRGAAAAAGSAAILAVLLARRLDGLAEDLRSGDPAWRVVIGRLVLDQRPGQELVGRRRR